MYLLNKGINKKEEEDKEIFLCLPSIDRGLDSLYLLW